jgi:hypothetical protein
MLVLSALVALAYEQRWVVLRKASKQPALQSSSPRGNVNNRPDLLVNNGYIGYILLSFSDRTLLLRRVELMPLWEI